MSSSEFDRYKVDYLFLLVGENPLPNYVAAKLLLKPKGTLYLVHTGDEKTGTYKQARRLQDVLGKEPSNFQSVELISLGEYDSDAFHIQNIIQQYLPGDGQVGLNYTGGTKAMAVHAYRAVFKKYSNDAVFSYLNPRRLEMCIDQENGDRTAMLVTPQDIEIDILTIFELHALKWRNNPTKHTQLPDLSALFANLHTDEVKVKHWFRWFYPIFCEGDGEADNGARKRKTNGQWGNWKSKTALANLSFSTTCLPSEILEAFRNQGFIDSSNNLSLALVKQSNLFKELEDFCKWLDGIWLEHYTLEQILSLENSDIHDYGINFVVPLPGTKNEFEFDVAFTQGYQLFAVSCSTTADRGLCKLKLFEAHARAQRMGGSEARVALICCANDPDSLREELIDSLEDQRIKVFGRSDLTSLGDKIFEWIQDANS